jgi:uncharacterized protein (DUF1778 family)
MPNKRSDEKRLVTFWFTHKEAELLAAAASSQGLNMTDFVRMAISELIAKEQMNEHNNAKRGTSNNG